MTDLQTAEISVLAMLDYSGVARIGCRYLYRDAISPIIEFTLFNRLTLGYSLFANLTGFSTYQYVNHEILLKYSFSK
jgi:hypothetical protein